MPEEDRKRSPYHGTVLIIFFMCAPSALLTWLFYAVVNKYQAALGFAPNWATAKLFGCGLGVLFHLSFIIVGAFKDSFKAVTNRVKEFFADLSVSASLAFKWYWDDVKENGVAFWIYFAIMIANAFIAVQALLDFIALSGSL